MIIPIFIKRFSALISIAFIVFFSSTTLLLRAQNNIVGYLELAGRTKKDGKDLSGAKITLYKNNMFEKEVITGRNGKFKFYIDYGYDYKITFTSPGCIDMYLLVFAKIPKQHYHLMPYYELGEVPFFEPNNTNINLDKYKEPFTKIIFDGKSMFVDDDPYLDAFVKDIYVDPLKEAQAEAERIGKEKAEQRAKREALERAKEEERIKAEMLALAAEEARAREEELKRLKEEELKLAALAEQSKQALSAADVKLMQEREANMRLQEQNKMIKKEYETALLAIVAANEKDGELKTEKIKPVLESNSIIEKMRLQAELKSKAEFIREQEMFVLKKKMLNTQIKTNYEKQLLEAATFAERTVKISKQTVLPQASAYKKPHSYNVAVSFTNDWLKNTKTTTVTLNNGILTYRKETYFWGFEYFYKNNQEIDEEKYNKETGNFQIN